VGTTSLLAQGLKPALTRFLDGGASEESFAYDLLQMKRQLGKEKGVEGSLWNLLNWFGFGNQKLHHQLYTQCLTLNQEFGKNCAAIERNRMRYDRGYREQLLTEISELTAKAKAIEIPEPLYQAIDSEFKSIFGKWAKRTAVCRRQAQTLLKDMNLPDVEQPSAVVDLRSAYSGSHNN
jgi:hypothetical protein